MRRPAEDNPFEDEKQVDVLKPFAPKIRKVLKKHKDERKLSAIASKLGFHPSRLTEMITKLCIQSIKEIS
jgi:hypothetical protein